MVKILGLVDDLDYCENNDVKIKEKCLDCKHIRVEEIWGYAYCELENCKFEQEENIAEV